MKIEQFLMGGLLGDSCIPKLGKGAKNNRLSIAHSAKQECYLRYKHAILEKYNLAGKINENKISNSRYSKGGFTEFRFKSKSNEIFNKYRELFYPEGYKIVPDCIKDLDEEGLAIWFMDDGYRTGNNLKGVCFATHSFDERSKQRLLKLLTDKFELKCSLHKEGIIYVWVESVPKLIQLISPFVPSCMEYKIKGSCINRVNCKNDGEPTCSQAANALAEGSTTTGGIGSLNAQLERPTSEMMMT